MSETLIAQNASTSHCQPSRYKPCLSLWRPVSSITCPMFVSETKGKHKIITGNKLKVKTNGSSHWHGFLKTNFFHSFHRPCLSPVFHVLVLSVSSPVVVVSSAAPLSLLCSCILMATPVMLPLSCHAAELSATLRNTKITTHDTQAKQVCHHESR